MPNRFQTARERIRSAPRLVEQFDGEGRPVYVPEIPEAAPSRQTISSKLAALREGSVVPPLTGPGKDIPAWMPPPLTEEQVLAFCQRMGIRERPGALGFYMWGVNTIVTPVQAHDWLSNLVVDNRDPYQNHVLELILDLLEGHWMLHHQGIGISPAGTIQDGWHRLQAIYDSRVPAPLLIVFNVTDRARMAIDTQMRRRPQDVAHAISMVTGQPFEVESRDFPVLRSALQGIEQQRPQKTKMQLISLSERHRPPLDFVHAHFSSTRQGATAPVLGAIMRAWYHVDRQKLSDYCKILRHGQVDGQVTRGQRYAGLMRDWLMGAERPLEEEDNLSVHAPLSHTRKSAKHWHFFGRATRSIRGFVAGEYAERLTMDTESKYPLPSL